MTIWNAESKKEDQIQFKSGLCSLMTGALRLVLPGLPREFVVSTLVVTRQSIWAHQSAFPGLFPAPKLTDLHG